MKNFLKKGAKSLFRRRYSGKVSDLALIFGDLNQNIFFKINILLSLIQIIFLQKRRHNSGNGNGETEADEPNVKKSKSDMVSPLN